MKDELEGFRCADSDWETHHAGPDAATGGHSEYVKHRRADNSPHSDVALRDERAYHIDEQLRRRCGRGHKRGARHIVWHVECYREYSWRSMIEWLKDKINDVKAKITLQSFSIIYSKISKGLKTIEAIYPCR